MIASILNDKPKIEYPKSRSFVKSVDQALYNHEKKMIELKTKNESTLSSTRRSYQKTQPSAAHYQ